VSTFTTFAGNQTNKQTNTKNKQTQHADNSLFVTLRRWVDIDGTWTFFPILGGDSHPDPVCSDYSSHI